MYRFYTQTAAAVAKWCSNYFESFLSNFGNKPVSLCGELVGNTEVLSRVLRIGIRNLEELLVAEIDLSLILKERQQEPAFRSMRPDLYEYWERRDFP